MRGSSSAFFFLFIYFKSVFWNASPLSLPHLHTPQLLFPILAKFQARRNEIQALGDKVRLSQNPYEARGKCQMSNKRYIITVVDFLLPAAEYAAWHIWSYIFWSPFGSSKSRWKREHPNGALLDRCAQTPLANVLAVLVRNREQILNSALLFQPNSLSIARRTTNWVSLLALSAISFHPTFKFVWLWPIRGWLAKARLSPYERLRKLNNWTAWTNKRNHRKLIFLPLPWIEPGTSGNCAIAMTTTSSSHAFSLLSFPVWPFKPHFTPTYIALKTLQKLLKIKSFKLPHAWKRCQMEKYMFDPVLLAFGNEQFYIKKSIIKKCTFVCRLLDLSGNWINTGKRTQYLG